MKDKRAKALASMYAILQQKKKYLREIQDEVNVQLASVQQAISFGDLRESSEYSTATEQLASCCLERDMLLEDISLLDGIDSNNYISTGAVKPLSFIHLEIISDTDLDGVATEHFLLCIGLNSVKVEDNLLTMDTPVYIELENKRKGDVIDIKHLITGKTVTYKLIDII